MRFFIFLFSFLILGTTTSAQCDNCYDMPFLGVYSNGISKNKAKILDFDNTEGSYITGVIGNTGAEKAGLQPFDYVYGIDEYRTDYGLSLTAILRKYDPGDEVLIHFYRNGKKEKLEVALGTRSDAKYNKRNKREDPFLGVEQRSKSWEEDAPGVKVNIVNNSTAEAIGLEDGDIISHINGFPIIDWTDLGTAIDMSEVGNQMEITFIRDGNTRKSSGNIKSYAESKYNADKNSYSYKHSYKYDDDDDDEDDDFSFGSISDSGSRDIEGMNVAISDASSATINALNEDFQTQLSSSNNLSVNGIKVETNEDKGIFELKFQLNSQGNTMVDIFNARGRNIYNYDLGNFSGDFEDPVDLAQNGPGKYYLKIVQDNKSLVKELILAKN